MNLCASSRTCNISADILNHIIPGTVCSSHFWVSFLISFRRWNGKKKKKKKISHPCRFPWHFCILWHRLPVGGGRQQWFQAGFRVKDCYLAGIWSERDKVTALKLTFHRMSPLPPHTLAACCWPRGLTVKADLSKTRTAKGAILLVFDISTISNGLDKAVDIFIYFFFVQSPLSMKGLLMAWEEARTRLSSFIFLCVSIPLIAESFNELYIWLWTPIMYPLGYFQHVARGERRSEG